MRSPHRGSNQVLYAQPDGPSPAALAGASALTPQLPSGSRHRSERWRNGRWPSGGH